MTSVAESPLPGLQARLQDREAALAAAERSVDRLGNLRLVLLAVAVLLIFLPLWTRGGGPWLALIPLAAGFVILGVKQDRAFDRRRRMAAAVRFYRESVDRLEERWRELPDEGADFAGPGVASAGVGEGAVATAQDLDLFGKASLFQLLCRAATAPGRRTLARWLAGGAPLDTVVARQAAVAELAPNLDLRESLVTASAGEDHRVADDSALLEWAERAPPLPVPGLLAVAGVAVPLFTAAAVVLYVLTEAGWPLAGALLLHAAVILGTRGMVEARAQVLSGPERVLMRYARLIQAVEAAPAQAGLLNDIHQRLATEGVPAARQIARLQSLVNLLDARLNMFFALSVGPATLWELNLVLRTERWRRTTGPRLRGWLEALGDIEALASLAALAHERPDYAMPEMFEGAPAFTAEGLSHPLIDRRKVVANDLDLGGPGSVLILSGSNMSGKSTLLRAVGLAVVLAEAGAPVPARRLRLSRMRLATSVRIVDSLAHGTSHFYAELARLKHIVDEARVSDPPLLYLLDEMLHGTNSKERYIGAVSVVRWLSLAGAMGIVTTHDLALAKVADTLPAGRATNQHFCDEVLADRISFDYRLREGPVQSTNALRLMKAVGIDVELVEPA
ncbi:MAG: DNA mismatch repair protein MutS [Myxococcales bacterium]|nr:DNA mismatch repair protein MutS [Myxococcales bacterium]MCB9646729.1 DNA mismatch repair protein MutS [Deltaproteobacteria bacterium]